MEDPCLVSLDDPAYRDARAFIMKRGVLAGPTGHTPHQLWDELRRRRWLPSFTTPAAVAGHVAAATKRDPLAPARHESVTGWGTTPVVALTLVLARAMQSDDARTRRR